MTDLSTALSTEPTSAEADLDRQIGSIAVFRDDKGNTFFSAIDLAAIGNCSQTRLIELVHKHYATRVKEAICCIRKSPGFEQPQGFYIAAPCFNFLLYNVPELAQLRYGLERRCSPHLTWTDAKTN